MAGGQNRAVAILRPISPASQALAGFPYSERERVGEKTIPARNPKVVLSRLTGGESVLLHLESGAYHELNPVGTLIWDLVDGNRNATQIAEGIRGSVDNPPDDLQEVVSTYLAQLRERDLIR